MKAIVGTKYGPPDVLQLEDVEKPAPKDHEVRIRVYAATVTAGDCEARSLKFPLWLSLPMRFYIGFRKPGRVVRPGQELAGEVDVVGKSSFSRSIRPLKQNGRGAPVCRNREQNGKCRHHCAA